MNACRLKWDIHSPPVLATPRFGQYGRCIVATNQYDPYTMFKNTAFLKQRRLFPYFQKAVFAIWRLDKTKIGKLKAKLKQDIDQSPHLTIDILTAQLRWCIQATPPQFQLSWPSVNMFQT